MREFLRGWKRKVGCVSLMMACVFGGAWARSLSITEKISYNKSEKVSYHFISTQSRFVLRTDVVKQAGVTVTHPSYRSFLPTQNTMCWDRFGQLTWRWPTMGFDRGHTNAGRSIYDGQPVEQRFWIIPYWSVVLPLTLMSAWLLISKPRAKKLSATVPTE